MDRNGKKVFFTKASVVLIIVFFNVFMLNKTISETYNGVELPSTLVNSNDIREVSGTGLEGCLTYGPYIPMQKGKINITVYYETNDKGNVAVASSYSKGKQFGQCELIPGKNKISFQADIDEDISDLEVVTLYYGTGYLRIDKIVITGKNGMSLKNVLLCDVLLLFFLLCFNKGINKKITFQKEKLYSKISNHKSLSSLFDNINKVLSKRVFAFLTVTVLMIIGLCVVYQGLKMEYPLLYQEGDDAGVFYVVKTIRDHGLSLVNPDVGGNSGADMYDYPFCSNLSFGIVWLISLFVNNVYTIANIFFFLCMVLAALACLYACLNLQINNEIAVVVSVLYGFMPFMAMRYSHMWLVPCFMMPLSILVAIWIIDGKINFEAKQWWKEKLFWQAVVISLFSAGTGLYYAFFVCVIYAIAVVVKLINCAEVNRKRQLLSIVLLLPVVVGVGIELFPNLVFWIKNGTNPNSELSLRGIGEAEIYGLKLIQMFLPRIDHRVGFLRKITSTYYANYPLINENSTAVLGIMGTIGFVLSLIILFSDKNKNKKLAYLNTGLFLVGTIGGIGAIFSLLVHTPMRAYNRISVLIMFVSLLTLAVYLGEIKSRLDKLLYSVLLIGILLIGVFDQTVPYQTYDTSKIDSTQEFVEQIENMQEEGSMVFQLPYVDWPSGGSYRMFAGYLASNELKWSFGSMQGRPEALWQKKVSSMPVSEMVPVLIENGYDGIFLDVVVFRQHRGEEELYAMISEITNYLQKEPLVSRNGELYYWSFDK